MAVRGRPESGYAKGDETRQRLLDVALAAFGEAPFGEVTTRQIAAAARVSLPSLQYYFGDKEGLYRACAEAIVERFRSHTAAHAAHAREVLGKGCDPETARVHLRTLIGALGGFLIGSDEAASWGHFVARELRDPGPAFEILYERLWRPGVETTALLIARILGTSEGDSAVRVQALLLISSALAFQSGRRIAMRTMHWSAIGHEQRAIVLAGLNLQIDAIGRSR